MPFVPPEQLSGRIQPHRDAQRTRGRGLVDLPNRETHTELRCPTSHLQPVDRDLEAAPVVHPYRSVFRQDWWTIWGRPALGARLTNGTPTARRFRDLIVLGKHQKLLRRNFRACSCACHNGSDLSSFDLGLRNTSTKVRPAQSAHLARSWALRTASF